MIKAKPAKGATCFMYRRVSSLQQKEKGSIARQDQLLPALVRRRSLRVIGDFRDDGVSGRTIEGRAGLSALLAALPKHRPDYLVFLRPDRFGRAEDWATLQELVNAAPDHHVHLLFLKEDDLTGELSEEVVHYDKPVELYRFMGEVLRAGEENKRRGRDSRQGNFSNLLRGRWPFGQVPFGWRYDRTAGRFVAVPEQIGTLRYIYEQAAAGKGTALIAQDLRRRKVLLPKAVESEKRRRKLAEQMPGGEFRWDSSAIRRLLQREYHCTGIMRHSMSESYPDLLKAYHEGRAGAGDKPALTADGFVDFALLVDGRPAIDPKAWKAARTYIDRRAKRHGGQRRGESRAFLFGPWLACGCGANIKARTHRFKNPVKGMTEYRYYSCRNHAADTDREGRPACTTPHLRADEIDGRLWTMLLDWISRPSLLLREWLKEQKTRPPDADALRAEISRKQAEKAGRERSRAKWLDLFAEESIDKTELTRRSRADAAEIARLDGELGTVRAQLDGIAERDASLRQARTLLAEHERAMTGASGNVRAQLDALDWQQRRTLLTRLFGAESIVLQQHLAATIRGIQARRAGYGEAGQRAADEFMGRWCVVPPGPDGLALMVKGVLLPVNPVAIMDALAAAGVRPVLSLKGLALR